MWPGISDKHVAGFTPYRRRDTVLAGTYEHPSDYPWVPVHTG